MKTTYQIIFNNLSEKDLELFNSIPFPKTIIDKVDYSEEFIATAKIIMERLKKQYPQEYANKDAIIVINWINRPYDEVHISSSYYDTNNNEIAHNPETHGGWNYEKNPLPITNRERTLLLKCWNIDIDDYLQDSWLNDCWYRVFYLKPDDPNHLYSAIFRDDGFDGNADDVDVLEKTYE